MKILLTAFGSFGDFDVNPSSLVVEGFEGYSTCEIRKAYFEVNREAIEKPYLEILEGFRPNFIINVGLHGGSGVLNLETFAVNSLKDERKFQEVNQAVAHRTKLDTSALAAELCLVGIPAIRSDHAGNYYCNFIYYLSLEWCQKNGGDALFLHIPMTTNLAARYLLEHGKSYASLPKKVMQDGIDKIIRFVKQYKPLI